MAEAPIVTKLEGRWDYGEGERTMTALAVGIRYPCGMTLVSLTDIDGEPIGDCSEIGWLPEGVIAALEEEERELGRAQEALRRESRRTPEIDLLPFVPVGVGR